MVSPTQDRRKYDLAIADQCRLNILWVNGATAGERALEIVVPGLDLHPALQSMYRSVVRHPGLQERAVETHRLPFESAAFDLVTLYGRAPTVAEIHEVRRVVRPGGVALFAAGNCYGVGRRRWAWRSPELASMRLSARLEAAGFREVRTYWVDPSLELPRNQIPAVPDRVRNFEASRAREIGAGRARSLAVKLGLHEVLFPAMLFVSIG